MVDINIKGMEVAPLNESQMDKLREAEKSINNETGTGEVYLLAVTRK
ncbi:MAG: hypothetical protein ACOY40_03515 [Bacillota bacterium]